MTTAHLLDQRPRRTALRQAALRVFTVGTPALTGFRLRRTVDAADGLGWLGATDSARTAETMIRSTRPDVLVLHNAVDPNAHLATYLTLTFPWLAIVVLVEDASPADRHVQAGVHAVLPVSTPPAVLVASIRLAHGARSASKPGTTTPSRTATELLSERQHEILALIADGNSYAEVGKVLYISTETVRTHAKQILRRLNARDRAHAVSLAYQAGLLGRPAEPDPKPSSGRSGAQSGLDARRSGTMTL